MKKQYRLCWLLLALAWPATAQDLSGYWLGVDYPTDPGLRVNNYVLNMTRPSISRIGGTSQTANPGLPFGGVAAINGQFNAGALTFRESSAQTGNLDVKDVCFWDVSLTYNPTDESLIGTYTHILNPPYCPTPGTGKIELYRIVLKSGDVVCQGEMADMVVTGKDIRWYDSARKTTRLATGNRYSTRLTATTTFYVTQTLYGNESPPLPITVQVRQVTLASTRLTHPACNQKNGALTVVAAGTDLTYRINGGDTQTSPTFADLFAGPYQVLVADPVGCTATQTVSLTSSGAPVISDVRVGRAGCGQPNGSVEIVASGSNGPLNYSIDGRDYRLTATFTGLTSSTVVAHARDARGCETTRTVAIPENCQLTVFVPTAFSPNQDGRNDALQIFHTLPRLRLNRVTIYARWGAAIYTDQWLDVASGSVIWDGTVSGQPMPVGTYICVVELDRPDGTVQTYVRSVELLN